MKQTLNKDQVVFEYSIIYHMTGGCYFLHISSEIELA